MDRAYAALGRFVVRFRYLMVIAWVAITIICAITLPTLNSVVKSTSFFAFLPASAPSSQAAKLAAPFQNTQYATATIVAVRNHGPLTSADQTAIAHLEGLVRAMPHVKTVSDLSPSPDGAVSQIAIQADVPAGPLASEDTEGPTLVKTIRQAFGQMSMPAGLTFHLTGDLATSVDAQNATQATANATQILGIIIVIVLLFVAFRSFLAPLLTLIPVVLILVLAGPAAGPITAFAVTRLGVPASSVTSGVLAVTILGAGADYGLFLTFRVREELRRGLDPKEAVIRAVQTVGETLTFSALTVIVSLSMLIIAQFELYQSIGPSIAIAIALLLLAGLTLTPALLAIFGRAVFWPTSTSRRVRVSSGLWGRLTERLMQRPAITLIAGIILFVGLALGQLGTSFGGFGASEVGPAGADSTVGTAAIAAHYPAPPQNPAVILLRFPQAVWNDPSRLATAAQGLMNISSVQSVLGPLNPTGTPLTVAELAQLHTRLGAPQALSVTPAPNSPVPPQEYIAYQATGQYISADGQTVQFIVTLKNTSSSSEARDAIPGLRTAVARVATEAGASQSGVVSANAVTYDVTQISNSDLIRIIPIVAVLITLLLILVLRSLIAALYLLASVVLSYLATWGATAIIFVHLQKADGVFFILPFVLFVFLVALGSDYNILVMLRIREEAQSKPLREAVREALTRTGGTVTAAGIILASSFTILVIGSTNMDDRQLGLSLAIGILMDTFLIRTLLIPSLVVLLGRWNWWPSRLFHSAISSKIPEWTFTEFGGEEKRNVLK